MGIFYFLPQPNMGAAQPLAPRTLPPVITAVRVDNPPTRLGGPVAIAASIVGAWQPDPWVYDYAGTRQPYDRLKMSPGIPGLTVDRPPTSHHGRGVRFASILAQWQPDPWVYDYAGGRQAYDRAKLSPAIPGQSVNPPPFMLGGPIALKMLTVTIAQPDPWTFNFVRQQPYQPARMAPGIPGQSINNPPFMLGGPLAIKTAIAAYATPEWSFAAWPYAELGASQPYTPRKASPRLISVGVDPPPFTHPGRLAAEAAIIAAWVPPPPFFHLQLYASRPTPQRLRPTARGYVIL